MTKNPPLDVRLKNFARAMRKSPTDEERALWRLIRDRRLGGFKFRRQVPLGRAIADFVCVEAGLVVEVDGGQHAENVRDSVRTAALEAMGYRVLRFWNFEVRDQPDAVAEAILFALGAANCDPHPASGVPSPGGRGN